MVCGSFCRRLLPNNVIEGIIAAQHLDCLDTIGGMWEYQLQSTGPANSQAKQFLEEELVAYPDQRLATAFEHIVRPMNGKVCNNENIALQDKRDALLTKSVLGELQLEPAGQ